MLTLLTLGITVGMLVVAIAARRSRHRFQASGVAFRCRLRFRGQRSAIWPLLGRRWSRPMWALWDDDVLIVRRGPVLARTIPLRAQLPAGGVYHLHFQPPRRCGARPLGVVLKVWDGSQIEVAAATDDRLQVVGPYLTAAISDLPPPPRRST